MSRLRVAALCLVVCVTNSTLGYSKRSGDYPSSSKTTVPAIAPFHGGKDRRTTHWESRSNSNLENDRAENDRDEGRSRTSYSSFLEQLPPLGYQRRSEQSVKLSNVIDVTAENVEDDLRLDRDCIPLARKPLVLVTFGDGKKSLNDIRGSQKIHGYPDVFGSIRCRRRMDGWNVQEPVYVEEPGWILIDLDGQMSQGRSAGEQDPFYVARGKRSLLPTEENIGKAQRKYKLNSDGKPSAMKNYITTRLKREIFNGEGGVPNLPGVLARKSHPNGYVELRNKHSDILDILNEPFFISRGKKSSMRMGMFELNNRYAKVFDNFEARKQALENYFSRAGRSEMANNCKSSSGVCNIGSLTEKDREFFGDSSPFRDRRGVMEELLKEADPFYIARGKRSMSELLQLYNGKKADQSRLSSTESQSTTGSINDNSSVDVEH